MEILPQTPAIGKEKLPTAELVMQFLRVASNPPRPTTPPTGRLRPAARRGRSASAARPPLRPGARSPWLVRAVPGSRSRTRRSSPSGATPAAGSRFDGGSPEPHQQHQKGGAPHGHSCSSCSASDHQHRSRGSTAIRNHAPESKSVLTKTAR